MRRLEAGRRVPQFGKKRSYGASQPMPRLGRPGRPFTPEVLAEGSPRTAFMLRFSMYLSLKKSTLKFTKIDKQINLILD